MISKLIWKLGTPLKVASLRVSKNSTATLRGDAWVVITDTDGTKDMLPLTLVNPELVVKLLDKAGLLTVPLNDALAELGGE